MDPTPIPIGTRLRDIDPEENRLPPAITILPLVGSSSPARVIPKSSFDIRKPRVLEITELAIAQKRPLLADEVKDFIAVPIKVVEEPPIVEEPIIEKP